MFDIFLISGPARPANLRKVDLDAPESKISLKVEWDEQEANIADCDTTYM